MPAPGTKHTQRFPGPATGQFPVLVPPGPAGICPHCGTETLQHYQAAHNGTNLRGDRSARYQEVDWAEAFTRDPGKVEWLVEPILEAGSLNSLYARPGTGKSLLALVDLAVKVPGHVVYVDDENRLIEDNVVRLKSAGITPDQLSRLHMYSFQGLPMLDTMEGGNDLLQLALDHDAVLVVIDTTSRFISGDENDSGTFLRLYNYTLKPLRAHGIAVLRLDHPGKNEDRGQRGSSAKEGDLDSIWHLTADDAGLEFTLKCEKSRSGNVQQGTSISIRKHLQPTRFEYDLPAVPAETVIREAPVDEYVRQLDELGIDTLLSRRNTIPLLRKVRSKVDNNVLGPAMKIRRERLV